MIAMVSEMIDKVICDDCRSVLPRIEEESVDLVITSPPYGRYKKYSNLEQDLGNLDIVEQKPIFLEIFREVHRILKSGRKFVLFFSDIVYKERDGCFLISPTYYLVPDILQLGFRIKNIFIWRKMGSFSNMKPSKDMPPSPVIQSYFEYIFVFQKNGRADYSYVKEEDKKRSHIPMKYVTMQSGVFVFANDNNLKKVHPAVFPVELIKILVMLYSFVGDVVLDPFNGIGTVCEAAKSLNRHYIGIDINKKYCEIAEKRLKDVVSEVEDIQDWIRKMREMNAKLQGNLF